MLQVIFSCFFTFIFVFFIPLTAKDNLRIEMFRGCEISSHIQEVVELIDSIYRKPPYLYNGDNEGYTAYIESYARSNDAMICLAFDGEKIIGLAIGIPMSKTRDIYKQTLVEHGYDLDHLFYLGEFGLKSDYHDCGIEEAMYLKIENFVRENDLFNMICLWEIESSNQRSFEDLSRNQFREQLGFIRHSELNFQIFWTNIGDIKESEHLAIYFMKDL